MIYDFDRKYMWNCRSCRQALNSIINYCPSHVDRPVENHSGAPGNFFVGPPNIIMWALWREFLKKFSVRNGTFWRTLYFLPTVGRPNVVGPRELTPSTPPSRRACVLNKNNW